MPRHGEVTPCQHVQEPGEHDRLDRFDLASQARQRAPPEPAQHLDVAPFALEAPGSELAVDDAAVRLEPGHRLAGLVARDPEAVRDLGDGERRVRAGVPGEQVEQRFGDRLEEGAGEAARVGGAKGIAEPRCILGRGHPGLPGDPDLDGPAVLDERRDHRRHGGLAALDPGRELGLGQVAEVAQQVVDVVEGAGPAPAGREPLQLELHLADGVGVEQVAQLVGAEQLAQQVAIEGERGRTALGERSVALVHVDGDPTEQQRLRER